MDDCTIAAMGVCMGGAVGGGVGPGGKGPEDDDSAAILTKGEPAHDEDDGGYPRCPIYYVPDASYFGVLVIEGQMNNVLLLLALLFFFGFWMEDHHSDKHRLNPFVLVK